MTTPVIAVLSVHRHPRLRYVLSEAGRRLNCSFKLFTDEQKYLNCDCTIRIRYATDLTDSSKDESELSVYAHPFLAGKDALAKDLVTGWGSEGFRFVLQLRDVPDLKSELAIREQGLNFIEAKSSLRANKSSKVPPAPEGGGVQESNKPLQRVPSGSSCLKAEEPKLPAFFSCPHQLYYDPFSIIFYCLSRYEEYQPFSADDHGRFPASVSHARSNNYLDYPLVDHLLAELGRMLELELINSESFFRATYDVDVPFAYQLRGWRGVASGVKDLLTGYFRRSLARFGTLLSGKDDPFDTFDQLRRLHADQKEKPRVFFLLTEKRSAYDPNPSPSESAYQHLIRETAEWAEIGIHPSYYSSTKPELFQSEKETLKQISDLPITHSRQHFLRVNLPVTYRELIRAGITNDHSMGYASEIGWRAGTNESFFWYDLEREQKTHLLVHPFGAMEVTLLRYKNLATLKSKEAILNLYENLSPLGGPCTLLWHNSSFADDFGWKGWWEMYADLIRKRFPAKE